MAKEPLRQVNVRISADHFQTLDALAFLEEKQPSPLLRPVVEGFLDQERNANPRIDEARRLRAAQSRAKGAQVTPIKQASSRKPTGSRPKSEARSKRKG